MTSRDGPVAPPTVPVAAEVTPSLSLGRARRECPGYADAPARARWPASRARRSIGRQVPQCQLLQHGDVNCIIITCPLGMVVTRLRNLCHARRCIEIVCLFDRMTSSRQDAMLEVVCRFSTIRPLGTIPCVRSPSLPNARPNPHECAQPRQPKTWASTCTVAVAD